MDLDPQLQASQLDEANLGPLDHTFPGPNYFHLTTT